MYARLGDFFFSLANMGNKRKNLDLLISSGLISTLAFKRLSVTDFILGSRYSLAQATMRDLKRDNACYVCSTAGKGSRQSLLLPSPK